MIIGTVHLLSSFDAPFGIVKRNVKENGRFRRVVLPRPEVISYYNQFMNGVDRNDQCLSYVTNDLRSPKPYTCIFTHFILVVSAKIAVMNNVQNADKRYWPIILNSFVNRKRQIEFKK
jgi:hypothetical protein